MKEGKGNLSSLNGGSLHDNKMNKREVKGTVGSLMGNQTSCIDQIKNLIPISLRCIIFSYAIESDTGIFRHNRTIRCLVPSHVAIHKILVPFFPSRRLNFFYHACECHDLKGAKQLVGNLMKKDILSNYHYLHRSLAGNSKSLIIIQWLHEYFKIDATDINITNENTNVALVWKAIFYAKNLDMATWFYNNYKSNTNYWDRTIMVGRIPPGQFINAAATGDVELIKCLYYIDFTTAMSPQVSREMHEMVPSLFTFCHYNMLKWIHDTYDIERELIQYSNQWIQSVWNKTYVRDVL